MSVHSSHRLLEKVLIGIFFVAFLLGAYRIVGYFLYNIPYGYDPGFFRYAIAQSIAALPELPPPPSSTLPYHEPLFGILSTVLSFIGFSSDTIIGPFLGFLSIVTAFVLYFLGKQISGRPVGLLAASIFLLSIIQYQEYWWNYWRNIAGIIFLITSLGLMFKKSPLAVLSIAGLFTMHRPSALFFAVVAVIFFLIESIRKKRISSSELVLLILGGLVALPLYANQFHYLTDMIEPLSTTIGGVTSS